MSTLRVSNIEAKADVSSPSVNEKVKVTNSNGELLVHIDGATSGITTVGINTSGESVRFDSNQNVTFFGDITGTGLDINGNADISGNLNVGGVLTYEDVTNIDAVGIITARAGIHVTGGSVGIGTDNPTETLTVNHANGASIGLEYSGIENGTINVNSAAMYVRAGTGKHLILGSNGTERLRITSDGNVSIQNDSGKFTAGASDDLQIYHSGSDSFIDENGTGDLKIRTVNGNGIQLIGGSSENMITCAPNGAVKLYYDNSKKLETTTTGATITSDLILDHASGDKAIRWATGGTNKWSLYHNNGAGALIAYDNANNAERLRITSGGAIYINQQNQVGSTAKLEVTGTLDNTYPEYSYPILVTDDAAYNSSGGPGGGIGFAFKQNSGGAYAQGGGIRGFKENTTDGNYASAMAFYTRPNGAGVTERLRITSAGQLNLAGNMQFTAATPEIELNNGGPRFRVPSANTLTIHTGGGLGATSNEQLRITSAGQLSIGSGNNNLQGQVTIFEGTDFNSASQGGRDNIYLISDRTSGNGQYGSSIAWSRVQYPDRRAAAIVNVQTSSDEDQVGLAFFTHPSATPTANIEEKFRITHDGQFETNGVRNIYQSFVLVNNTAYNWDFTVPSEGGYGNSFYLVAGYNHYFTTSYGAHRTVWFSSRSTSVGGMGNGIEQYHSQSGNWTFSKPNSTTVRITKTAGTYGGSGYGFFHLMYNHF